MRVLVTRPLVDAERTASRLRQMGHEPLLSPLLVIQERQGGPLSLDGVQAIVVTSANGVRAVAHRVSRRDVPVFAVGEQTAAVARNYGFAIVRSAAGDSSALAAAAANWARPEMGSLMHAAGSESGQKLSEHMSARGFRVRREILYDVRPAERLTVAVETAIREAKVDAVLLYSPLSAQIFSKCIRVAGLAAMCAQMDAICISRAAADAIGDLALRERKVATHPSENAMLKELER